MDEHPGVTVDRIIGHREVNDLVREGRLAAEFKTMKTCPGGLVDMDEIREQVREQRSAHVAEEEEGAEEPTVEEIREALDVLGAVTPRTLPNALEELRSFLFHPEVMEVRALEGGAQE